MENGADKKCAWLKDWQTWTDEDRRRAAGVNVLIACEESGKETNAFLDLGFNAYSCDLNPTRGGRPDRHIFGNVRPLLRGFTTFITEDDEVHQVDRWHLIISHPPCTYLCKVSSVHMVI